MRPLTLLGTWTIALGLLGLPHSALACSLSATDTPHTHPNADGYPTNGLFFAADWEEVSWWVDGAAADLVEDEPLSALLGRPVYRTRTGLTPGAVISSRYGEPVLVGDGPDLVAPARPTLDVRVRLVERPSSGAGASCPELDILSFDLHDPAGLPLDDRTPDSLLTALVYIGPTPQEAEDAATPSSVTGAFLFGDADPERFNTYTFLGLGGHRAGTTPYEKEELCMAVEMMDAAGNISPRSSTVCFSTVDRGAPTTSVVAGSGCSVGATRGGGRSSIPWLMGAALGACALRRRRGSAR